MPQQLGKFGQGKGMSNALQTLGNCSHASSVSAGQLPGVRISCTVHLNEQRGRLWLVRLHSQSTDSVSHKLYD